MAAAPLLPRRVYMVSPVLKAEDAEQYKPGGLHPILLGDTLKDGRYRIVHKLGFGSFSTVWLARDTLQERYVSLKMTRADFNPDSNELRILRHLAGRDIKHAGYEIVMRLEDHFVVNGPNGNHHCIVTQVAGPRLARPAGVNYACLGPSRLLASQMFRAVEYLHGCNVGHGDLYTGDILLQLDSFDSWSDEQVYACLGQPVREPLYRIDGNPVTECAPAYTVHPGDLSGLEARMLLAKVLIIDFGQAYFLNEPPDRATSPNQFSAPENILSLGISTASDDVLKDMVAMLGKFPEPIWKAWDERHKYFDDEGRSVKATELSIPVQPSLFSRIRNMAWLYPADGHATDFSARGKMKHLPNVELVQMHDLLSKIFQLETADRLSVEDALAHPFLALISLSHL